MMFSHRRIIWIILGMAAVFVSAGIVFWLGQKKDNETAQPPIPPMEGFVFLDMGNKTSYNEALRDWLKGKLGSDAIETRSLIDLETNFTGFLETYFPRLDKKNKALNASDRARVEHDATRLMYRYAVKKGTPFKFVELVFDNRTRLPLYFKVISKKEGKGIVDRIREKYGASKEIGWRDKQGRSLAWEDNGDVMIVSLVKDRLGDPEYRIVIYFSGNIKALIESEKQAAADRIKTTEKAGGSAF